MPVGVKPGAAARPEGPIVFQADALLGPAVLPAVAIVGFGLARVGIVAFGRLAAKPVDEPVLAQPVMLVATRIPAHVPAVRMDIVTPSRLCAELSSKAAGD